MNGANCYQVYKWMHEKLGLTGVTELVYACIFGCTGTENGEYAGSARELADFIGYAPLTVYKALRSLTEKGYIIKREFTDPELKIKRCAYRAEMACRGNL